MFPEGEIIEINETLKCLIRATQEKLFFESILLLSMGAALLDILAVSVGIIIFERLFNSKQS